MGVIYKFFCNITGECYIGSTISEIRVRKNNHQSIVNKTCSNQIIDRGDYTFSVIETNSLGWGEELRKREQYYMDNTENVINKMKAYTELKGSAYAKQYYHDNLERMREHARKSREKHKDKIKERAQVKMTCECGAVFCYGNKGRHLKSKAHLKYLSEL